MAQCAVHALKGLADRAPVLLAHAEVSEIKYFFNESKSWVPYGSTRTGSFRAVNVGETSGCGAYTVASV